MKRFLIGLLVWLLSVELASAAVTITSTSTIAAQAASSGTSMTFTGVATGTAAADRITVADIGFADGGGTGIVISSVTIGGSSATCTASVNDGSFSSSTICWILNTTGTSANIVVTFSSTLGSLSFATLEAYSVRGANTTTPVSSSNTATALTAPAASITIPSGGGLIAGSSSISGAGLTPSWSNATADQLGSTGQIVFATATSSSSGTVTVTNTWSGGASVGLATLSLAAFQQASGGATSDQSLPLTGFGN